MTPDKLFQLATPLALLGWLALLASPLAPRVAQAVSATAIPLILSLAYAGLILAFWWEALGGFSTLAEVQALFTHPFIALAGWLHYLAFDLFLGAWEVRTAQAEGIPHWAVVPCLILTFLFGPVGLLAFAILRFTLVQKVLP
jgi:Domain of unknown function (DUF4281)